MSRKKMSTRKAFMKKECVSKSPNNYAEGFFYFFELESEHEKAQLKILKVMMKRTTMTVAQGN